MSRTPHAPTPEHAVEVPCARIDADVLRRLIEEFVTRDGTDYGATERALDDKVRDVIREIGRGRARLVFDAQTGTTNVVRCA